MVVRGEADEDDDPDHRDRKPQGARSHEGVNDARQDDAEQAHDGERPEPRKVRGPSYSRRLMAAKVPRLTKNAQAMLWPA